MSEWGYIGLAYGLTWAVLIGYGVHLVRRSGAAASAGREGAGKGGET